jgi:hypothetical protein
MPLACAQGGSGAASPPFSRAQAMRMHSVLCRERQVQGGAFEQLKAHDFIVGTLGLCSRTDMKATQTRQKSDIETATAQMERVLR